MKLSEHLSLKEVTKSHTALRLGIENLPDRRQLVNLIIIAKEIFEPLREWMDCPIGISSGFRGKALNKAVNGSTTSHHCKGMALDIDADMFGVVTNLEIFEWIRDNVEFTQLIWEYGDGVNPDWVHVSYDKDNLKNQILKAVRVDGRTKYIKL